MIQDWELLDIGPDTNTKTITSQQQDIESHVVVGIRVNLKGTEGLLLGTGGRGVGGIDLRSRVHEI